MDNTENSLQQRTGQVATPNVSNIQSGTPELYQQSGQGVQSTNSELLYGSGNTQILVPTGEPNPPQSSQTQTTDQTSNVGWFLFGALFFVVIVLMFIIRSATQARSSNKGVVEAEVPKPQEVAKEPKVIPIVSEASPKKPKKHHRKKSKKKKK